MKPWPLDYWERAGIAATLVILLAVPVSLLTGPVAPEPPAVAESSSYVGSESCRDCHRRAYDGWLVSHHRAAMAKATPETVLGDFSGAVFEHGGIASRFFRDGERFLVHTEGPDGAMADFEIAYTFGVFPLQQYLVPLPGGRLQAFDIAWDSREGRWYSLYPDARREPGDWLHWTGGGLNWNAMCAPCHSTGLVKGFDGETGLYQTRWAEVSVGCEACHGPGTHHVAWARIPAMARTEIPNFGFAEQTQGQGAREQVNLCARCHSRRMGFSDWREAGGELLDSLAPELLREGLYFADGQIEDEVFEYGSFNQSRMYNKGVRCSDCHDPHSGRRLRDGNALCLQCHRPDAYDTDSHHFHKKIHEGRPSEGALCEKCHMPGRVYMGVDYRLDHSIRIPRPDLTLSLATPNACNQKGCHDNKDAAWSEEHCIKWYGKARKPHYGSLLAAGRRAEPGAGEGLARLAADPLSPLVVRATALSLLENYPEEIALPAVRQAITAEEAILRRAGLLAMGRVEPRRRAGLSAPLLSDPVRGVRVHAAANLAGVSEEERMEALKGPMMEEYRRVLAEYRQTVEYSADFAAARMNLGSLAHSLGEAAEAEKQYRKALGIDRDFTPARLNLALLFDAAGRKEEAEKQLRGVNADDPQYPEAAYMLGLLLSETKRYEEAAESLAAASAGMPENAAAHLNLARLLQFLGRLQEAREALDKALRVEPDSTAILETAAEMAAQAGDRARARALAERLLLRDPASHAARRILQSLRTGG